MSKNYKNSLSFLDKAKKYIPNGIWGHNKYPAAFDHGHYPYFTDRAKGAYLVDIDGNEYIDYLCGYGSMINGYANEEIDNAVIKSINKGQCFPQPAKVSVELSEFLCSKIKGVDWCAYGKNGSDATSMAVVASRAYTDKSKIICIRNSYNGSHFWCNWCNFGDGRLDDESDNVILCDWNDVSQLEEIFESRGHEIAAIITTSFHHPIPGKSVLPSSEFFKKIEELSAKWSVVKILDDIRTGFRIHKEGAHVEYNYNPDLVCYCKAIANTYEISVLCGNKKLKEAAETIFVSGTFWNSSTAMVAALANLKLLYNSKSIEYMNNLGKMLADGLHSCAKYFGFKVEITGTYSVPTMTFEDDNDFKQMIAFSRIMVEQGTLLHPMHNWFVSMAHTEKDITKTLEHARVAFSKLK